MPENGHKAVEPAQPALFLTVPQLRAAVTRRLRENRAAGIAPSTRWQLAQALAIRPAIVYMVLAGTKTSRPLRARLEAFVNHERGTR